MRRADYSPAFRQLILPVTCTNPAVRRLAPLSLSPHPVRCLPCILCSVFCLLPTTPSLCPSISLCHSPHALILHSGFCILTSDFARPVRHSIPLSLYSLSLFLSLTSASHPLSALYSVSCFLSTARCPPLYPSVSLSLLPPSSGCGSRKRTGSPTPKQTPKPMANDTASATANRTPKPRASAQAAPTSSPIPARLSPPNPRPYPKP